MERFINCIVALALFVCLWLVMSFAYEQDMSVCQLSHSFATCFKALN